MSDKCRVAVIGGGWYGCYCSLRLREELGFSVTLFEAKDELFKGVSGQDLGTKLHAGPQYPRSAITRKHCSDSFTRFITEFPELYVNNKESIYCLGSDGLPPRVDWETFQAICKECDTLGKVTQVDCSDRGFTNVLGGFDVPEHSFYIDEPRHYFSKKLKEIGVTITLNHTVTDVTQVENGILLDGQHFHKVVNCTYYKDLISKQPLPLNKEFFYQPNMSLMYAQNSLYTEKHHPFSFTVMDGWFPMLVPLTYKQKRIYNENREIYGLYHAKYTHLGSFKTMEECNSVVSAITDEWVQGHFKPKLENSIKQYYSNFDKEFEYIGWESSISCKVHSSTEFRSTLVWAEGDILHVLSGKVSTIFQAGDDVVALITNKACKTSIERASCELKNDSLSKHIGSGNLQSRLEMNWTIDNS